MSRCGGTDPWNIHKLNIHCMPESSSVWGIHHPQWSPWGNDDVLSHNQQWEDKRASSQNISLHKKQKWSWRVSNLQICLYINWPQYAISRNERFHKEKKSYKVNPFVEFLQGKKSHKAFPYIQQRPRIIVLLKTFVGIRRFQTLKQTDSLFEFLRPQTDLNYPLMIKLVKNLDTTLV